MSGNRSIKIDVLKALLAKSGNRCAFHGCNHPIFNDDNLFIAQLCHIEAVSIGGERYNPTQTDEERNSFDNLMFMCYRHHKETDDVIKYSVDNLKEIKYKHESLNNENIFEINVSTLVKLKNEIEQYWEYVNYTHKYEHIAPDDLKMEINYKASFFDLIIELREIINLIHENLNKFKEDDENLNTKIISFLSNIGYSTNKIEKIPYYKNPFTHRNWEIYNLGIPNWMNKLNLRLDQLELKYYEIYLMIHNDSKIKDKFSKLKKKFIKNSKRKGYVD